MFALVLQIFDNFAECCNILSYVCTISFIFAWVFITSFIVLKVIDSIVGIRATDGDEEIGLDKSEIGVEAYPDFK